MAIKICVFYKKKSTMNFLSLEGLFRQSKPLIAETLLSTGSVAVNCHPRVKPPDSEGSRTWQPVAAWLLIKPRKRRNIHFIKKKKLH